MESLVGIARGEEPIPFTNGGVRVVRGVRDARDEERDPGDGRRERPATGASRRRRDRGRGARDRLRPTALAREGRGGDERDR